MFNHSRAGLISLGGMMLGALMLAVAVIKIAGTRNSQYAPLLFTGLFIGILSTPFYYYFKAKDRQANPYDISTNALGEVGKQIKTEHQRQQNNKKYNV